MGRHGGINILHQKSWHVWRMDNRLTVERDELKVAAQEREKLEAERQRAFSAKVGRLRRRALGEEEEPPPQQAGPAAGGSQPSSPRKKGEKRKKDLEQSFKWGMVTTSNLKQAEQDLDLSLKGKHGRGRYWGNEGLGTGPHINLFEGAELEVKRSAAEKEKQLQYTAANNELLNKSKKALFSEFDEIARDCPWYMRPPEDQLPDEEGDRSSDNLVRKWTERHGQAVLCVSSRRKSQEVPAQSVPVKAIEDVVSSDSEDTRPRKKEKHGKKARKAEELRRLRAEREQREQEERARASRLLTVRAS